MLPPISEWNSDLTAERPDSLREDPSDVPRELIVHFDELGETLDAEVHDWLVQLLTAK